MKSSANRNQKRANAVHGMAIPISLAMVLLRDLVVNRRLGPGGV